MAIQNRPTNENLALRRSVFQSVGELDQLRELVRGASLDISQLTPGAMRGMLAHVDLGQSSIHTNSFSLPARGRGSLASDRWTFVVFPADVNGRFNSLELNASRLLIYPPGSEFEGTIASSFQDWVFTVGFEELARVCQAVSQRDPSELLTGFAAISPARRLLDRLRGFAIATLSSIDQSPFLLCDEQVRSSLHGQLTELLSQTLLSATSTQRRIMGKRPSHWQIVRRAEDTMHGNLDQPVSLADLCSATRVSERTLRRAFMEVIGLSPNAYLKVMRLNRVHADLEQSSPDVATVTSVAMRSGFVHLGRLSQEYKCFFGEFPSVTLHQSGNRESNALPSG